MTSTWMKSIVWVALGAGACGPDKPPNDPTETDTGGETETSPTDAGGATGSDGATADSDGEADFEESCLKYASGPAGSALVAELCACRVANGSDPDVATCIDKMTLGDHDGACMCAYYLDHPDGQASIECLIAVDENAAACVASSACDEAQVDDCFQTFGADNFACPRPSDPTLDGLSAACPSTSTTR